MMSHEIGVGGFFLPMVYQKKQKKILEQLDKGEIDYAELSQWSFPDEFYRFISRVMSLDQGMKMSCRKPKDWFLVSLGNLQG